LTARRVPGGGDSTRVMKIASVEREIDVRDEDRGAVEEQDEAEERQAEDHVSPRERRVGIHGLVHRLRWHRLRKTFGHRAASTAIATKSSARQRREKWKSSAARRGVGSRRRPSARTKNTAPSAS